jgi:signal transduction histidine kinase
MGHELRTPIGAIIGMANIARKTSDIKKSMTVLIASPKPRITFWNLSTIFSTYQK